MDSKSDEEDHQQSEEVQRDSKTLVTALTQLLGQSRLDETREAQQRVQAGGDTTAGLVTTGLRTDNT